MAQTGDDRDAKARSLDASLHEQLYYQLYSILFEDIVNGTYPVGEQIPSETELMERYSVSRATVRRSMEILVNNGLIVRRRGRGSQVVSSKPATALKSVGSCIKRTHPDRVVPVKRVVSAQIVGAEGTAARELGVEEGRELYRLERIRCSAGVPYYLETIYLTRDFAPNALDHDFSGESLRAYYANILHVRWTHARQRVSARAADARCAGLLGVAEGTAILSVDRTSFDHDDIAREYMTSLYRSDQFYLDMSLEA